MQYGTLEFLIYLGENAFRIYIISLFFSLFFEKKVSLPRRAARYCCYSAYFMLSSMGVLYFHWKPAAIVALNTVGIFTLTLFYRAEWKYRICAAAAILAINIVCEDLTYRILMSFGIEHIFIIGLTVSGLLSFMIVLFLRRMVDFRQGIGILWQEWAVTIFIPACSIYLSAFVFDHCNSEKQIILGGISLILLNLFLFYLLDRIFSAHRKQLQMVSMEQRNRAYENQMELMLESQEKISSLKHDMKNHLLILHQMAENEHCEPIKQYLEKLTPMMETPGKFVSTGNFAVDGILNLKLKEAAGQGCDISTDIEISGTVGIDAKDLCTILGNLMDNAVKALGSCDRRKFLKIRMREDQGILTIQCRNSYSSEVKRSGKFFETTKENKEDHGLGLKIIERTVNDYRGELNMTAERGEFCVDIFLYLREES